MSGGEQAPGVDEAPRALLEAGQSPPTSLAGVEATWGAVCEFGLLGVSSGFLLSCYLASCGYFQERFDTTLLFGVQALVTYGINLLVVILQELFDDQLDRTFGTKHTYGFRIIACAVVASAVSPALPACQMQVVVLLVGAVISFFAFAQWVTSMSLAAACTKGGGVLVSLGFTVGGALPLLTTALVGYAPGCSLHKAYTFYVITCVVALLCMVPFAVEHMLALRPAFAATEATVSYGSVRDHAEGETRPPRRPSSTAELIHEAYGALSVPDDDSKRAQSLPAYATLVAAYMFLSAFFGFVLMPLFTLRTPMEAQHLYLFKCVGDVIGRAASAVHARQVSRRGSLPSWGIFFALVCLVVRVVLSCLTYASFKADFTARSSFRGFNRLAAVVAVYALGGYGMLMLDLGEQLEEDTHEWRKRVQRRNLLAQFCGQLSGIGVGLILRAAAS